MPGRKIPPIWPIEMPASDQGVSRDRYLLIPRTLIFITRGESVLLLKGAPSKRIWANRYNGLGGHIEQGEDVLSAARRELREETGLEADQLWLAGTLHVDPGGKIGIGIYVIKGSCSQGQPQPSPEGELEWVPFQEIQKLDLVEDLPVLLPRVLAQRSSDPPFSARSHYNQQDQLIVEFAPDQQPSARSPHP
jgi:8-oxo-dGTP diphosphatase